MVERGIGTTMIGLVVARVEAVTMSHTDIVGTGREVEVGHTKKESRAVNTPNALETRAKPEKGEGPGPDPLAVTGVTGGGTVKNRPVPSIALAGTAIVVMGTNAVVRRPERTSRSRSR